jgi:hypothetical protein
VSGDDLAAEAAENRKLRITRRGEVVELYFPPLRSPEVALPLAAFGAVAAAVPALTIAAVLPAIVGDAGNLLGAVLIAGFVLPFVAFGAVFVALAIYMLVNALYVRADAATIETARVVFGVAVKRHRVQRTGITDIEPQIASRYQSLFGAAPSYHLIARTRDGKRIVVAETLRGEETMQRVKALLDNRAINTSGATEP